MIAYLIILFILCIIGVHYKDNESILGKEQTTAIKGVFTIIVFLSHCRGYTEQVIELDYTYNLFDYIISYIGQLMVAPFLFFSGYGVFESIKHKDGYIITFFKNRIIPVILHLGIALILYIIINLILGISYPIRNYFLCWIGWESIGNSNWYVFDILILYFMTWTIFRHANNISLRNKIAIFTIATMAIVVLFRLLNKESWWYNTLLCYPLGMIVSLGKEQIYSIMKNRKIYVGALISVTASFVVFHGIGNTFAYMISTCLFCIVILLVSKKFSFENSVLNWIGMHLFEIYILQRIPMTVLSKYSLMPAYLFAFISWIVVCILAYVMEKVYRRADLLWRNVCNKNAKKSEHMSLPQKTVDG